MATISSRFQAVLNGAVIAAAVIYSLPDISFSAVIYDDLGNSMPYGVYLPGDYATGQDFPLVVFLHGSGDGGTFKHISSLMTACQGGFGSQYKSVLLIPQVQVPPGNFSWNALESENLAMRLIDLISSTYRVDTNRIYLTGLSLGGFGTWAYIGDYPEKFAAAVPLAGGGDPIDAPLIKDIPIWAFHGIADGTVPVTNTDAMFDAIEAAGGYMEYTRPEGVGHGGTAFSTFYDGVTYQNSKGQTLYQWMFEQALPVPEPASPILVISAIALIMLYANRHQKSHIDT
jgi:predicted peptidase